MKIKNIIISSMVMATAVLTLGSCNDFLTIYPTDKTIGPDFWKTKADVQEMVSGAYQAMAAGGIQERAIVWGSFRSDELEKTNGYSNHDLENISAANLLPSNGLNSWGDFYGVINRCNIVKWGCRNAAALQGRLQRVVRGQQTLADLHGLLVLGDEVVVALRQGLLQTFVQHFGGDKGFYLQETA